MFVVDVVFNEQIITQKMAFGQSLHASHKSILSQMQQRHLASVTKDGLNLPLPRQIFM